MSAALLVVSLLAVSLLAAAGCHGGGGASVKSMPAIDKGPAFRRPGPPPPAIASYQIEATLDASRHRITGKETLTWVNTGQSPVSMLPFHLYMNAFKNESSTFMQESHGHHRGQSRAKGSWGWIDVNTLSIDGGTDQMGNVRYPADPDETVMELPLATPVAPGATVKVALTFEEQLPEVFARTGYKGAFTMIGQWFPKIGVLQGPPGQEQWHCDVFHLNSEFFADFGTYDVVLTVPDTDTIAATGLLVGAVDNPDATRTLTYHAESVHDFAWMADPEMGWIAGQAKSELGPVEVRVYFRPDQRDFAERHLRAGIAAIEQFSKMLVPYPWPRMTIIDPPPDAAGSAGGMEYPTLVTTAADTAFAPEGVLLPEFVTVHEVGHNWFQGMLATNEVDDAWLDEGMNEYVDGLVMDELAGGPERFIDYAGFTAGYYALRAGLTGEFRQEPDWLTEKSYDFVDFTSYGKVTYNKTAVLMHTLEQVIGRDKFLAALKGYAQKYAFTHPNEKDLVGALESGLGQDLGWYLDPALHQLGAPDLEVRSLACQKVHKPRGVFGRGGMRKVVDDQPAADAPSRCDVIIENLGRVPVPVDVELTTAGDKRIRKRWDDRGTGPRWHRFTVESPTPVVQVVIDPDHRVPFDDSGVERGLRAEPDPGPSRRAAARGQFLTQSAMQVFGL